MNENLTMKLLEVNQKFQGSVNDILSDVNLDENLIFLRITGVKKANRRVMMIWFHVYYLNLRR